MRTCDVGLKQPDYTEGMDRVRFGRALGYGARHAARTLVDAAKAASTPSPAERGKAGTPAPQSKGSPTPEAPFPFLQEAGSRMVEAQRAIAENKGRARVEAVHASRSMLTPVRRAGGILWLEMTGTAFSLFTVFLAPGLWKLRAAVHAPFFSTEAHKFYLYLLMLILFTYFAVSSFVRAHRRGKRP